MYLLVYSKNNSAERNWYYFEKRENLEKYIKDNEIKNTLTDSFEITYDRHTCLNMISTIKFWHKKIKEIKAGFDELNSKVEKQEIDLLKDAEKTLDLD